jgi:hypothetical protein
MRRWAALMAEVNVKSAKPTWYTQPSRIDDSVNYVPVTRSTSVENALQIHPFVQNEPNFQNTQNHHKPSHYKGLRQYTPLCVTENKPKTNPNEPKANPIFRSSGGPKAKTNPNKPNFPKTQKSTQT